MAQTGDVCPMQHWEQLELAGLDVPGRLREALSWMLTNDCEGNAPTTIEDYRQRAEWLLRVLGDCPLGEISYIRLTRIHQEYGIHSPHGLKNVTIRRRFVTLLRAMRLAAERGIIPRDSVPRLPRMRGDGRARTNILHPAQVRELAAAASAKERAWGIYVLLGWWTGMHHADLVTMRFSDVDMTRTFKSEHGAVISVGMWRRVNSKNKVPDLWMPMPREMRSLIEHEQRERRPHVRDRICGPWPGASRHMARLCVAADLPRTVPSDLRRSLSSYLVGKGCSVELVRQVLGRTRARTETGGTYDVEAKHYLVAVPALLRSYLEAFDGKPMRRAGEVSGRVRLRRTS